MFFISSFYSFQMSRREGASVNFHVYHKGTRIVLRSACRLVANSLADGVCLASCQLTWVLTYVDLICGKGEFGVYAGISVIVAYIAG